MENRKVVFICAPYDAKDSIAHAKEIALVSHFRTLIEDMYHYKTYAPGSYLTGSSKEAKDFRVEIEDVILKNCHAMFVCGREVTGGMQVQITKAKVLNIPIYRVVEGKKGVIITMYVEQEKNMCKERRIPEILICSPCDAVTEEDAEKEYELRKHYKGCSEEESLSAALLNTLLLRLITQTYQMRSSGRAYKSQWLSPVISS